MVCQGPTPSEPYVHAVVLSRAAFAIAGPRLAFRDGMTVQSLMPPPPKNPPIPPPGAPPRLPPNPNLVITTLTFRVLTDL